MRRYLSILLVFLMFSTILVGCTYNVTTDKDGNVNISVPRANEDGEKQDVTVNVNLPASSSEDIATIPNALESVYKISHDVDDIAIPGRDYLIVVNKDNPYDFDGDYNKNLQADLVFTVNAVDGDVMAVEKATYLAFTMLQRDLRENDGIDLQLYDGYRTAADQEYLQEMFESGEPNVAWTNEVGLSEHHTGLLLDVVVWTDNGTEKYEWYSASPERWEKMNEFKTIFGKLADYGFIVRYPEDKADITGIEDKSFEIRFVGSKEIAHKIMDNGICLEEYLAGDEY